MDTLFEAVSSMRSETAELRHATAFYAPRDLRMLAFIKLSR
jgi:hypothetical protein